MQEEPSDVPVQQPEKGIPVEKIPETGELFDLVIPPGTPQSVIADVSRKYDIEVVERKERLHFANMDGDERILLAFRGKLSVMKELEPYFYSKVKEFIDRA